MKIAFVGGKYRGETIHEVYENIQTAKRVSLDLWRMGYASLCPHLNTSFFDGAVYDGDDDLWLKGALVMLRRCDLLVLVYGWQGSAGARKEKDHADKWGIPTFEFPADVEYLKEYAHLNKDICQPEDTLKEGY